MTLGCTGADVSVAPGVAWGLDVSLACAGSAVGAAVSVVIVDAPDGIGLEMDGVQADRMKQTTSATLSERWVSITRGF